MRCLVTGAAGFIGSTLSETLLAQGHDVLGVDCFLDYYPREVKEQNITRARAHKNYRFVEADLLTADMVGLLEGVEWVFHQAAQAGVRASWGKMFETYTSNNILATQRLLEAARSPEVQGSLRRIIYASSSSIYGHSETLPTPEFVRPQPISPYGVSKLAAENLCVLYAKEFGVPTVSLRYFTVYGPRQRPDMGFHKFVVAAISGKPITIYGDGAQSRDFTYVDDIVAANISAAHCELVPELAEFPVLNIGGGSRVTINEVVDILSRILGSQLKVEYVRREAGDARHTGADISRAKKLLHFTPEVSLEDGLRAEVEWLRTLLSSKCAPTSHYVLM